MGARGVNGHVLRKSRDCPKKQGLSEKAGIGRKERETQKGRRGRAKMEVQSWRLREGGRERRALRPVCRVRETEQETVAKTDSDSDSERETRIESGRGRGRYAI